MKSIEVVAGVIRRKSAEAPSAAVEILATQRGYGDYKGGWEFPGGKMEPGESPRQALARELKEELSVDVRVDDFICTVDHDYPDFHITMHCYYCEVVGGTLTLLEHESARWLEASELRSVGWLPADISVVECIECGAGLNTVSK
ncbi:MAG: (deoxy)nucleoside triphosphate pyrophosphohydrolase [Fibrobacter sp.]|nr:(deoxy)nucleoside triphosphate pyrophosphohydrolase [Fibrobacter sp.]